MSIAALLLGLLIFIAVLRVLNAQKVASGVIGTTHQAMAVMANSDINEDEKEAQVKGASLKLLGDFFKIAAIGAIALGASALLVWGGAEAGLYDLDHAIALAVSWPFILGSSAAAIALWIGLDRLRKSRRDEPQIAREEVPYSPLDKALHDFAFDAPERQIKLAEFETKLYRRRINLDAAARPVFITSLPRAGTTILLEVLAELPHFASATYSHMPFTMSPLLWGGFSNLFRKAGDKAERAHGDGIEVGVQSPEAFEEMLWMAFWSAHYAPGRIVPWTAEETNPAFDTFLRTHMAKIVATKPGAARYVSKNNANIARLGLIERQFPDATILVPIRNPRAQVHSLLRQHLRFCDLHAREPFAKRYMEGIGHFEFGQALRPIEFQEPRAEAPNSHQPEFWLRYWIDAYAHVLATAGPRTVFVDHDALCTDPARLLPELATAIGLVDAEPLLNMADVFRAPHPAPDLPRVPRMLIERADTLHGELKRHAIGHEKILTKETPT